jgi:hypothetical protein
MEAEMTTYNEYPKSCSMREAIDCVLSGGEVQTADCNSMTYTGSLARRDGIVYDSSGRPLDPYWRYQITKPAPSAPAKPRTYSTAEAITELYAGRAKKFTGTQDQGLITMTIDNDGDVIAYRNGRFDYIPNLRWSPVVEKPAAVEGTEIIRSGDSQEAMPPISGHIINMRQKWPGDVRVTWKVEAV